MKLLVESLETPVDINIFNLLTVISLIFFIFTIAISAIKITVKDDVENLKEISIKGNVNHSNSATIKNIIYSKLSGNFLNLNLENTREAFEAAPWVKNAIVKRIYPNKIEVMLSEFNPVAVWGARENMRLVDDTGVIFEIDSEAEDYESLPHLIGSDGQSKLVLDMYKNISKVISPLNLFLKKLEISDRGSWIATLNEGAKIELGRGNVVEVMSRVVNFATGLNGMLTKLNKKLIDVQYVDLRHTDGYAIRMNGVSTFDSNITAISFKK